MWFSLIPLPCYTVDFLGDFLRHRPWKEDAEKVSEDEEDIRGKIVIVTGSNTGIGKQVALQLAKRGARVIMAVRNLGKGEEALEDIKMRLEGGGVVEIELMKLDLGDLESIRNFVKNFQEKCDSLDILVNNAGYMNTAPGLEETEDGFERHVGVNCLGPFLLTGLLLPWLQKSSVVPSRVVCVTSSNFAMSRLNFMDDLMMEKGVKNGDNGMEQYNISKLCSTLVSLKLGRDLDLMEEGRVKLVQVCPGIVDSDLFAKNTNMLNRIIVWVMMRLVGQTTHQGCETIVYCAVSKGVVEGEDSGKGEVYRTGKIWERGNKVLKAYVRSPEGREVTNKLYDLSEELVGLKGENGVATCRSSKALRLTAKL